jgi:hypothetical protein
MRSQRQPPLRRNSRARRVHSVGCSNVGTRPALGIIAASAPVSPGRSLRAGDSPSGTGAPPQPCSPETRAQPTGRAEGAEAQAVVLGHFLDDARPPTRVLPPRDDVRNPLGVTRLLRRSASSVVSIGDALRRSFTRSQRTADGRRAPRPAGTSRAGFRRPPPRAARSSPWRLSPGSGTSARTYAVHGHAVDAPTMSSSSSIVPSTSTPKRPRRSANASVIALTIAGTPAGSASKKLWVTPKQKRTRSAVPSLSR